MTRISTGQGLPWPKPASFKKMIGEERHRVTLLKMIELRLRVRKQNTLLQAVDKDIRPVVCVYLSMYTVCCLHVKCISSLYLYVHVCILIILYYLCMCTFHLLHTSSTGSIQGSVSWYM